MLCMVCGLAIASCNKQVQKAEYSGENLTGKAEILRDKQTKAATIRIDVPGEWQVYAGPAVEAIDFSKPVASGNIPGVFPIDVPVSTRSYFQLVTPVGKAILAERHLPMTGGYNFRDLGGYRTTDGRYVKWGKILRSDDLHKLTPEDIAYLGSLPLVSVVDFRSAEEMAEAPDKMPASATNYACSITPGNLMGAMDSETLLPGHADSLMREMNRLLVTDSAAIAQYHKLFELLQNERGVPLMFHCSAGKDRTGMGAALILSALGVNEETILNDYLLSNTYLADKYSRYITESPDMEALFTVRREYLEAGLEQIRKDHGSVENYLRNVLDVDLEKMREMYLY